MKKRVNKKKASKEIEDNKKIKNLLIRYGILLVFSFIGVNLFYKIFLTPTTYISYWFLSIFFETNINQNLIVINGIFPIEIIGACVAASAYLLLIILNLSTPGLSLKKRFYSISLSIALMFTLNILRIFLLANVYLFDFDLFEFLHWFFWYFVSLIFVICIWFSQVKMFEIKSIPFYTDLKYLYNLAFSK